MISFVTPTQKPGLWASASVPWHRHLQAVQEVAPAGQRWGPRITGATEQVELHRINTGELPWTSPRVVSEAARAGRNFQGHASVELLMGGDTRPLRTTPSHL